MKFTRTKKLAFFNNKGWVWKTTIAYNTAVKFAEKWYKTVLVDLDPQCNLSLLSLWRDFLEDNLFSDNNVYWVLKWVIEWWSDVNTDIQFQWISKNLSVLQWSLKLSNYENSLISSEILFDNAKLGFNEVELPEKSPPLIEDPVPVLMIILDLVLRIWILV